MARSAARKWFGIIHLWVGLFTGIIVLLISITGCMYVFRDELFHWAHRDLEYHKPANTGATVLPCSVLWEKAQQQLGKQYPIEDVTAYTDPDRNWEFAAAHHNDSAVSYFRWIEYDKIVYVNPYTAEVAGELDHKLEFFQLVKMFHWSLLLHTDYGQPIVGVSVLLFVVSLISGLVIWWPKNTKAFRESIKVKWRARWRRINYDLHRSLAFYTIPLALIIALTGLVWAFRWMLSLVYIIASLSVTPPVETIVQSKYDSTHFSRYQQVLNQNVSNSLANYANGYSITFYPANEQDTSALTEAYIRPNGTVYYNGISEKYDRYSGKLLHRQSFADLNNGQKMIYMNYDIHVGAALGLTGKILAFCASLICASLPVTGFLIWWGRRKKVVSKKEQPEAVKLKTQPA